MFDFKVIFWNGNTKIMIYIKSALSIIMTGTYLSVIMTSTYIQICIDLLGNITYNSIK